ncbi:hypothetical protein ED733_003406 [Metarhizium rileyi]|uniref:Uncharacterized protein n=1 Tax=Metarhizium rileyi (strain RCEF 4871) TaxID=1649241 RepID=A0A5C6GFV8_METRR|nr:hypothetical protein ED733_003406 [Metarhizium rileyi]
MSYPAQSLEQSRLEIILLAAIVLVLVLLFGVFILNERWDAGASTPYQDEGLLDNVRLRSVSIAEEIRKELTSLKQFMTPDILSREYAPSRRNIGNLDSALYNTTTLDETYDQSPEHMLDDMLNWHDFLESPASSTGRDWERDVVTRSKRAVVHSDSCDLEAQDSDDSDH